MLDRLQILLARARRLVSRNRWSGRFLGAVEKPPSNEPGLVLLQIDGLGETALREAIRRGRMPFLRRLVEGEGHEIVSVYAGLPSTTPGFQAEIYYGREMVVPGFGFLDRAEGRVVSMGEPRAAAAVEGRLRRAHRGLLRGGSSWSNVFAGGARESHLCAATIGLRGAIGILAPRRFVWLVLFHLRGVARVLGNLVAVTGVVLLDLFRGRLGARGLATELKRVPVCVAISALAREVVTAGASVDAERGLPIVYANLLGYDEYAHRRGPDSRLAGWSLRGIDASIRRVWLSAHRSRARDYQVWILSDHGQESAEPYRSVFGETVPAVVERAYRAVAAARGEATGPVVVVEPGSRSRERLSWLGANGGGPDLRRSGRCAQPARSGARAPTFDSRRISESGAGEIVVTHRGPVGFVYLPHDGPHALAHPLARSLAAERGIPGVLVADGAHGAVLYHGDRILRIPEDAAAYLGDDHPHLEAVSEDLRRLAHHPDVGDLTLLGWNRTRPLTLQNERGTHGGPGPGETSAFAILPPETRRLARLPSRLRAGSLRSLALHLLNRPLGGPSGLALRFRYEPPPVGVRENGGGTPLRVLTYNVHRCRGIDGKYSPERIARVIARERPDVVCLQELDQERLRSGGVDQVRIIARRLRIEYQFHAVARFHDGRFGNAVLSPLPMRLLRAGPLPSAARAKRAFHLEDRGALCVAVRVGGEAGRGEVLVVNTHLSILARERILQVAALLGPEWLGTLGEGPLILTGDFNAAPQSETMRRLHAALRGVVDPADRDPRLRTWSGHLPLRRIDHILFRGDLDVARVGVPRTHLSRVASDHLPLVADLVCRFPRATTRDDRSAVMAGLVDRGVASDSGGETQ